MGKSQTGTLDSSSGQEDSAVALSTAEVVGPSDSSPTPVRGRASLGERMGFAVCPVCLLPGLAGMWAGQRGLGMLAWVAQWLRWGGEGQTSEMPIKPRARRLPDVRGLVTRITQSWPLPVGLHLTEGVGRSD